MGTTIGVASTWFDAVISARMDAILDQMAMKVDIRVDRVKTSQMQSVEPIKG